MMIGRHAISHMGCEGQLKWPMQRFGLQAKTVALIRIHHLIERENRSRFAGPVQSAENLTGKPIGFHSESSLSKFVCPDSSTWVRSMAGRACPSVG